MSNLHAELEEALLALDNRAMVLEELDGFIAGLLVCPELILPGEWYAAAFGLDGGSSTAFQSIDHANAVLSLVMKHYNAVATTLERWPEQYVPLLPIDDGDVIWELWVEGFAVAIGLRPKVWNAYMQAGGDAALAMEGLIGLVKIAEKGEADSEEIAKVSGKAADIISEWVRILHAYRMAHPNPAASFANRSNPFAAAPKVGRNDPCPCGSGQRFKRCCGAN